MKVNTLANWHQLVTAQDTAGLHLLLAEDVVFHSPIVHAPQAGKMITTQYLTAAFHVFFNESFEYVRELVDRHGAVLEFQVEIEGVIVNGVDMIKWNEDGKIVEFKVMLRPMKAINLIREKMAAMLRV